MKKILEKRLIESLIKSENQTFTDTIEEKVVNLVANSVQELGARVPFVSLENVILQPVNETFNGTVSPVSKFIYFLGIDNPQMELNCLNYSGSFKKFKQRFVQAWNETKRKKKKRKKELELEEKRHEYSEFEPEKYNLDAFKRDLQLAFVQNLSTTSIVFNISDRLVVQGKDEFGSLAQIEIIPVIFDGENFKYFRGKKKGFININMKERTLNFNIKYETAGENFFIMLKLFNNLFKNITRESVNQIFVESLLYNIPDEFYQGDDLYNIFINIVNYLNMTDISNFVSIENKSEKIFKSELTKNSIGLFNKFMRKL